MSSPGLKIIFESDVAGRVDRPNHFSSFMSLFLTGQNIENTYFEEVLY